MNIINGKNYEDACYDTNRVNMAINNQYISNNNFTTNIYKEMVDVESGDLMKVLLSDNDFAQNYNSIKRKENINIDFSDLPLQAKFDLLIKNFFYLKTEKETIYNEYLYIKNEFDEQLRKQDIIVNEQIQKYIQETYKFKCLYEELKSKLDSLNEKNQELLKKNEEINNKFDRLKEKNNEKENLFIKLSLEKNLIEAKYEKLSKEATEEISNLNSIYQNEKKEKENLLRDIQFLYRKNEEFKMKYEEVMQQNQELTERNKNLERISKIDKKTLQEYGTILYTDGVPLEQIYTTTNSINTPDIKEEKKTAEENFIVQMEVNIAKINKNTNNTKFNLNQANIVQAPIISSTFNENLQQQDHKTRSTNSNKNDSYIANLLEDQSNVIQIVDYSEHDNSEIQQTENSIENDGDHGSNNYTSGNIIYNSNNYDSLRNFQPRLNNRYDTEENNYNSIRGENYSSSVSGIFKP